jgi:meprin A
LKIYEITILQSTNSGCHSFFGRQGGRQIINLGPNCVRAYIVQHEFMHAMGFPHMQSVFNRDKYVKILTENILEGREFNFFKLQNNKYSMLGLPYDYESILHYPPNAFSKNALPTMVSLVSNFRL